MEVEKCKKELEESLNSQTDNASLHFNLGVLSLEQGDESKAAEDLVKSAKLNPDDFLIHQITQTGSSDRQKPEDRLSSLPEEILFVILSFLTFEEKAMTSLLSHQWLSLWLRTPVLIFRSVYPEGEGEVISSEECLSYTTWVNHVVQRHKGQCLTKFEIVCDLDNHYQKDIDNWLAFALSRKVQCLELNLFRIGYSPEGSKINYVLLPDKLLKFCTGKADSNGGQFDLECLKHLSLKSVDVTCDAINLFLSHCPFLERLEVEHTRKLVNLEISGPNLALKYLKIKYCFGLEVLAVSNFNLVSLDISSVGDLTLKDLPMLVELSITNNCRLSLSVSHSFSQATSFHSQLEALALWGVVLDESLASTPDAFELSNFRRLTKLKRLTIEVITCDDQSMTKLASLVNACPCLEEFTLVLFGFDLERSNRAIIEVDRNRSSPKSQSLKVVEFSGYRGRVSDDELIIHVVENAVCLEKIIIDPYDRRYMSDYTEMSISLALKQLKDLRESGSIPPHVHVVIREP